MKVAKGYRHELKYLLTPAQSKILSNRLKAIIPYDPYAKDGRYRVTSLYLDDAYHSAYNDKIAGIGYRRKYRIRAYNLDPNFIRLEVKNKESDVGWKESVRLTLEQYHQILQGDFSFCNAPELEGTAAAQMYVSNTLMKLRPAVVVDYRREAFIYPPGNVRICFDSALSVLWNTADMFRKDAIFMSVPMDMVILEIKYDAFLPTIIQTLMSDVSILQESVSKFVICTDFLSGGIKKCTF